MDRLQTTQERKQVNKTRTWNNLVVILAVIPAFFIMARMYVPFIAWATSTDPTQVSDLGPDIYQPIFVLWEYVSFSAVASVVMALLFQGQFKEGSFGPHLSRFAALYLSFFLGAALIAAGIL